jgi:hypothetical protein
MSYICVNCGALTEMDDAEVPTQTGRCFCFSCLRHLTGDEQRVSRRLMREIATEEDALRNQKIGPDPRISQRHGGT